jgi:hypothetical protein
MIYPDRIKEFKIFQRMFARNIREQHERRAVKVFVPMNMQELKGKR